MKFVIDKSLDQSVDRISHSHTRYGMSDRLTSMLMSMKSVIDKSRDQPVDRSFSYILRNELSTDFHDDRNHIMAKE